MQNKRKEDEMPTEEEKKAFEVLCEADMGIERVK